MTTENLDLQFGDDSQEDEQTTNVTKTVGLKQGDALYRIMPSMFSLKKVKNGYTAYHAIHWGFAGVGKEPGKLRLRPFECVRKMDWNTKVVTQECDVCVMLEAKRQAYEDVCEKLKSEGKSDEEVKEITQEISDWLFRHNKEGRWFFNAMTPDGTFVKLKLSGRTKKQFDTILEGLRKDGVNPLHVREGLWFNFTRKGFGRDTQDTITPAMETQTINGQKLMAYKSGALTDEQLQRALNECTDLQTGIVAKLTPKQVTILAGCGGDPESVDRVFNMTTKNESLAVQETMAANESKPATVVAPRVVHEAIQAALTPTTVSAKEIKPVEAPVEKVTVTQKEGTSPFAKMDNKEILKMGIDDWKKMLNVK